MSALTAKTDQDKATCPIRSVLANVMGKWSSLILLVLEHGPQRFSAIKRIVGDITQRVLTENLRSLEADGYITRRVEPGPPIEVHYELTDIGREFVANYKPLVNWALTRREDVYTARADYAARTAK